MKIEVKTDFKGLESAIERETKNALMKQKFNISCPHCHAKIYALPGKSRCPNCGKEIDLSLDIH